MFSIRIVYKPCWGLCSCKLIIIKKRINHGTNHKNLCVLLIYFVTFVMCHCNGKTRSQWTITHLTAQVTTVTILLRMFFETNLLRKKATQNPEAESYSTMPVRWFYFVCVFRHLHKSCNFFYFAFCVRWW